MAVKVRFREQANSREVLDFTVFLSPNDMWQAWTDRHAVPRDWAPDESRWSIENGWVPGIRTTDTSCIVPEKNGNRHA